MVFRPNYTIISVVDIGSLYTIVLNKHFFFKIKTISLHMPVQFNFLNLRDKHYNIIKNYTFGNGQKIYYISRYVI